MHKALLITGTIILSFFFSHTPAAEKNKTAVLRDSWNGFYLGGQVGADLGSTRRNWPDPGQSTGDYAANGVIGGGTIGYNKQKRALVFGIEGDISGSSVNGQKMGNNYNYQLNSNWLATIRPRLGYAFGSILPYVTAGLAAGDVNVAAVNPTTGHSQLNTTHTQLGWTAGAGIETSISSRLSVKAEYLYVKLAETNAVNNAGLSSSTKFDENILRIGVNYRFF